MDGDGISDRPVRIAVAVKFQQSRGRVARGHAVTVDFTGSDPQVQGSINAVEAITYSACFYVFRCLLAGRCAGDRGLDAPDPGDCPLRDNRECAASGGGGGRECGNFATDRGCSAACLGAGDSRADSRGCFGNHEQSHHRRNGSPHRRAVCLLRNHRRRDGCSSDQAGRFGCAHPHDEFAEHAGGGAGVFVSAAGAAIFPAAAEAAALANSAAGTASSARSKC